MIFSINLHQYKNVLSPNQWQICNNSKASIKWIEYFIGHRARLRNIPKPKMLLFKCLMLLFSLVCVHFRMSLLATVAYPLIRLLSLFSVLLFPIITDCLYHWSLALIMFSHGLRLYCSPRNCDSSLPIVKLTCTLLVTPLHFSIYALCFPNVSANLYCVLCQSFLC